MSGYWILEDRFRFILKGEFDLSSELLRLQSLGRQDLAVSLSGLHSALVDKPARWSDAKRFAEEVADNGWNDPRLEHLRNTLLRSMLPLLSRLPKSVSDMIVATEDPLSEVAQALEAAHVLRIFVNDFDPH